MRRQLAAWLCPEMARDASRFHYMLSEMGTCYRWLAEFKEACVILEWCVQRTRRWFGETTPRGMIGEWLNAPNHISDFRDGLRKGLYNDH